MKVRIYFTLFLLAFPVCASAGKDSSELPPPTAVQDTPEARKTIVPEGDNRATLQEELNTGKGGAVDLRVYQRKDGTTIEEYSMRGRVYMIRVKPPGSLPAYYLYDNDGDGKFERRLPGGYKRTSPPAWVIKRF